MDPTKLEKVKRLAIIGLFSDDELMDSLVLKGGNALDIVYGVSPRSSIDIDLSTPAAFEPAKLKVLRTRFENALRRVFRENGYEVFDVILEEKPEVVDRRLAHFWGGYQLKFKLIGREQYEGTSADLNNLRRRAEVVGPRNIKTFTVDISKYEYCEGKQTVEIDGYVVYVYSPAMIAFEKLRAICQQTEEYRSVIGTSRLTARARDFFDIHTVIEYFNLDIATPEHLELLRHIFKAKHVPLELLNVARRHREFHRPDFAAVIDTLKPGVGVKDFDFYFDYVVEKCAGLSKALRIE